MKISRPRATRGALAAAMLAMLAISCRDTSPTAISPVDPAQTATVADSTAMDSATVWIGIPPELIPSSSEPAAALAEGSGFSAVSASASQLQAVNAGAGSALTSSGVTLGNGCGGTITGVAFDGTYYYVAEGGSQNMCITQYTASGTRIVAKRFLPDFRGLHFVPATGKLVGRTYGGWGGQLYQIDFAAGTATPLTSYDAEPCEPQAQPAADPDGVSFWRWNPCGNAIQRVRIADNVTLQSFAGPPVNSLTRPVGVSASQVFVAFGITVYVYNKSTGTLARTFKANAEPCVDYGFGVFADGTMLGYGSGSCLAVQVSPIPNANHEPLVSVGGPYAGSEGTAIPLSLAASDADGDALTIGWNLGDGTAGSGALPTSHTWADNGSYTITVSATDSHGAASTATTTATIANVAPTVSLTTADFAVARGATLTLDGLAYDPGTADRGSSYEVLWGDDAGELSRSVGTLDAEGHFAPIHAYARPGTFTATVRVTDKDGGVGEAAAHVTVLNNPPVAVAGGNNAAKDAYAGVEGQAIAFDGSISSDPDGDALTYAWSFGDGEAGSGAKPSHAYGDNGSYVATLTVTDAYGAAATATVPVVVSNVSPTAALVSPGSVNEGSAIGLTMNATDVAADLPLQYQFDCGRGYGSPTASPTAACRTTDNGDVTVRARALDKDGGVSEQSATVSVLNVAPTVTGASFPGTLVLHGGRATGTITSVTLFDPGIDDAPTFTIDCGNGTQADAGGACTWSAIGRYTVTITATDKDGGVSVPYTGTVSVVWSWTGFSAPVSNGALNIVKAGSAVPLKFSLDGNQGLDVFAAGFPASAVTACGSDAGNLVEETSTAGSSSLSYDAGSDQYVYVWKTDRAWSGSCRQLVVTLADGSVHRASFQFR